MSRLCTLAVASVFAFILCSMYHNAYCSIEVQKRIVNIVQRYAAEGDAKRLYYLYKLLPDDFKASVNTIDSSGHTLLHHAVYSGSVPAARLLLEAGAKPNVPCAHGDTPLSFARQGGNKYMIALLLGHIARDTNNEEVSNVTEKMPIGHVSVHK